MGERTDGLDPAIGSSYAPAGGTADDVADRPYATGDVGMRATDEDIDEADSLEVQRARAEIEETRAEMSETIDALKDRLSPQRLAEDARESVREATIGRAEEAVHSVADSAREMWQEAGTTAKGAGNRMFETIKQNPMPAALIGIGAGWLLMSSRQHDGQARYEGYSRAGRSYDAYPRASDYYTASGTYTGPADRYGYTESGQTGRMDEMKEKAGEVAGEVQDRAQQAMGTVRESAGEVSERARTMAHHAQLGFQEQLHDNPLGVGLAALALGVAVGFALPETRQENRWMGEARETVMERVSETAQEMAQKVQTVAQEAVSTATETVQQTARDQGLTAQ